MLAATAPDPQADLDDHIRTVRDRQAGGLSRQRAAEKFHAWGAAARNTARNATTHGDEFGRQLAIHRAEVYEEAALLVTGRHSAADLLPVGDWHVLRDGGDPDIAAVLMRLAQACSVGHSRSAPLTNYDQIAIRYSQARAWQLCAWTLDPDLPEVQPRWE